MGGGSEDEKMLPVINHALQEILKVKKPFTVEKIGNNKYVFHTEKSFLKASTDRFTMLHTRVTNIPYSIGAHNFECEGLKTEREKGTEITFILRNPASKPEEPKKIDKKPVSKDELLKDKDKLTEEIKKIGKLMRSEKDEVKKKALEKEYFALQNKRKTIRKKLEKLPESKPESQKIKLPKKIKELEMQITNMM